MEFVGRIATALGISLILTLLLLVLYQDDTQGRGQVTNSALVEGEVGTVLSPALQTLGRN